MNLSKSAPLQQTATQQSEAALSNLYRFAPDFFIKNALKRLDLIFVYSQKDKLVTLPAHLEWQKSHNFVFVCLSRRSVVLVLLLLGMRSNQSSPLPKYDILFQKVPFCKIRIIILTQS
jgi:hypothetical protein